MGKIKPVKSISERDVFDQSPAHEDNINKLFTYASLGQSKILPDAETLSDETTLTEKGANENMSAAFRRFSDENDTVRSEESIFKVLSFENKNTDRNSIKKCFNFWKALNSLADVQPCKCTKMEDNTRSKTCSKKYINNDNEDNCHCFLDVLKLMQERGMDKTAFAGCKDNCCKFCDHDSPYETFKQTMVGYTQEELNNTDDIRELNQWQPKSSIKKVQQIEKGRESNTYQKDISVLKETDSGIEMCACGMKHCNCSSKKRQSKVKTVEVEQRTSDVKTEQISEYQQRPSIKVGPRRPSKLPDLKDGRKDFSQLSDSNLCSRCRIADCICTICDTPERRRSTKKDIVQPDVSKLCAKCKIADCICTICDQPDRRQSTKTVIAMRMSEQSTYQQMCDRCGLPLCECTKSPRKTEMVVEKQPETTRCSTCGDACTCWESLTNKAKSFLDSVRWTYEARTNMVDKACSTDSDVSDVKDEDTGLDTDEETDVTCCSDCGGLGCDMCGIEEDTCVEIDENPKSMEEEEQETEFLRRIVESILSEKESKEDLESKRPKYRVTPDHTVRKRKPGQVRMLISCEHSNSDDDTSSDSEEYDDARMINLTDGEKLCKVWTGKKVLDENLDLSP